MVREFCLYNEIANSEEGLFGPVSVTTPPMLNDALAECASGDEFHLYVNSPGGSVFAATAMCAMIDRARAKGVRIEAYIDGLAASAASFVVMAADVVHAYESSFLMVHKPWSICVGNANDMRKEADTLDKLETDSLQPLYMRKAKVSAEEVGKLLDGENWLGSAEMAEIFDIDVIEGEKDVEQFAASVFEKFHYHAPEALIAKPEQEPVDAKARERPDGNAAPVVEEPEKKAEECVDDAYFKGLRNQIDCI